MSLGSLLFFIIAGPARAAAPPPAPTTTPPPAATPAATPAPAPVPNLSPAAVLPVTAAPAPPDLNVYRLHPVFETGVLLGGIALWTGAFAVVSPLLPNRQCDPCDPDTVNALDRPFIRFHNPDWRPVGHSMYILPAILFVALDMADVGFRSWKVWLTDFMIVMEGLILSGAVTEIWRRSIQRPRPFLYEAGVYPDERGTAEATYSFYSGHTASVYALVTGVVYTWTLRHPTSRWRWLVWTVAMTAALLSPIARVASGDHFPTDTLVGALVGTAFGLGWTSLRHWMWQHEKAARTQVSLLTSVQDGGMMVSVGGRF